MSLINDILDLSKIEEGKMEILPAQYELSSLINDLNNMIRDRAEKKGLNFEIDADPATPHILCGDETRLRQIILNLLTNAVKYTPKGSVGLNIKFEKLSEDEIDLTFTVNDTGMGMKEEDMDRLFAPYERIEEQRNRSIEGTGLGMSIVKNLLSLMNSQLEVSSVYGEGSVFSFTVSQKVVSWDEMGDLVGRVKKMSAQKGAYKELFHAPGGRLLVVDDTDINLLVITRFLKKTELKIDTASSGEQAINLAEMNSYDVMIIDHMMPGMDGIETLNRIKENEASKDAPDSRPVYIALTANAISGARERYLRAGFDDYLSKPVDGRQLEKILAKYLPEDKVELV